MITTKLYLYDSTKEGYKGEDFSAYIATGDSYTDDISDILGTAEITLRGLTQREEFAPSTKFIYEKWDTNASEPTKTLHLVVQSDLVTQPIISDDTYFVHAISFVEASAIPQGTPVDNISITYKLQDVSLDVATTIDVDTLATAETNNIEGKGVYPFGSVFDGSFFNNRTISTLGKKFEWGFADYYDDSTLNKGQAEWANITKNKEIEATSSFSITIPTLKVYAGRNKTKNEYDLLGYCSTTTTVTKTNLKTGEETIVGTWDTHPLANNSVEGVWNSDWAYESLGTTANDPLERGIITSSFFINIGESLDEVRGFALKQVAKFEQGTKPTNRRITFNIDFGYTYTITTRLKSFANFDGVTHYLPPSEIYDTDQYPSSLSVSTKKQWAYASIIENQDINSANLCKSISFSVYQKGQEKEIKFASAPARNAYELFIKAIVNTQQTYKKINGVFVGETTNLPYYVSEEDKIRLKNTEIVENFYNQKNLWEIFLEIGKYIHSIPKVTFGENEKFLVSFVALGVPKQYESNTNKVSIQNSRSLESYYSACTSYVTNMIQLGGIIDEWIVPKSASEDYLVYNDVAELKTSKNIIEIVDMEIKCIKEDPNIGIISLGDTKSLVGNKEIGSNGYIFEKNIYQLLDVVETANINKGLAIYYELGTNVIKGLQYQLPVESSGDPASEYAIKRIIAKVYGVTNTSMIASIKVNNFAFHIKYRTKGNIRVDQTRPDLRKYLLNNKYEKFPQHCQFNNQMDTLIDSLKFGNNVYGKLIRTGNSEYTTIEWVESISDLKNVGELYKLEDGNLYFVATTKNECYPDHIISKITYSKDYNQLSEIIGIPSEPRFYEISEQNEIDRQVSISEYLLIYDSYSNTPNYNDSSMIQTPAAGKYLTDLLFGESDFPKYAITIFKSDINNPNFENIEQKTICTPLNSYSVGNTLCLNWEMQDNFSAGDSVEETSLHFKNDDQVNSAYNKLTPIQYCDKFGRADLFDFIILSKIDNLTKEQIQRMPLSPIRFNFTEYIKNVTGEIYSGSDIVVALTELPDLSNVYKYPNNYVLVFLATNNSYHAYLNTSSVYGNTWVHTQITYDDFIALTRQDRLLVHKDNVIFSSQEYNYNDTDAFSEKINSSSNGLALLKDNREKISINYNIQLLTDSDRYVISSWVWQQNKSSLKVVCLNKEVNKLSGETIPLDDIIKDENGEIKTYDLQYDYYTVSSSTYKWAISINIYRSLANVNMDNVKAIAIISTAVPTSSTNIDNRYFVIARNVSDLPNNKKLSYWGIIPSGQGNYKKQ